LTQAGVIFGTPEYLSPEQALGDVVDARADIYAAGVILYEMLAGRRPFESEDKVKIISMHLSHAPPRVRDTNPGVDLPIPLEQAVLQALEKSREHRFATAAAFLQALDDAERSASASADMGATALDVSGSARRLSTAAGSPGRARFGANRRMFALGLVGVAVVVGASIALKRGGRRATALVAPARPPAPPTPDLAQRFKKAESMLEDGDHPGSRRVLEQVLAERPEDARVRYLLGRVAFADDKHEESLSHYREAISRDAGFRGDPVLLNHLDTMLSEPKHADAALALLIERIGAPAADLLTKVANEGTDLVRRRRAAAALDDFGQGKRVDRVSMAILELKKATSCDERKVLVERLNDLGDVRALPALRSLRGRRMGPLTWGASDTSCMKVELADAIKALEKKPGAAEHRPRRGR
jgi:hypothetical protein